MAHTLTAAQPLPTRTDLPPLDTDAVRQTRLELAACFRAAARLGLAEGICNHFSAMLPGRDDLFLVNPYGLAFEEVTASSLLLCDLHGRVLAGEGQPEATAFYIHARLHLAQPRLRAAFHTHMPNATALAMLQDPPLLFAGQTALKFHGRIAVDAQYNGLALDNAEGDRLAAALGGADVLFMQNHGVMVTGPNIAEAWDDLYYLERAAEVQLKAMASGRPLQPIADDVARRTHAQMREGDPASARAHLTSVMRVLRRDGVDFDR